MKKSLLLILSIGICLLSINVIEVLPVHADSVSIGIVNKINELRNKFPNGAYWNHIVKSGHGYSNFEDYGSCNNPDAYTWHPCNTHNGIVGIGGYDCNSFSRSYQCRGYAKKIFNDIFGHSPDQLSQRYDRDIKPGDYVSFNHINHAAIVISVSGNSFTVAEANAGGNCQIRWDATYYKSQIEFYKRAYNYNEINSSYNPTPDATQIQPTTDLNQATGDLTVTWPSVAYADFYCIRVDDSNNNQVFYGEVSNPSYQVNLPYKGLYHVYISANNTSGATISQWSYIHYRGMPADIGDNKVVRIKESKGNRYVYYDTSNGKARMNTISASTSEQNKYMFKILKQSDGSYVFQSIYDSTKVLDIYNNLNDNGTSINLYDYHDGENQKFWVISSDFNGYTINKKVTSLVLDSGGSFDKGLYIYEHTSFENQYQYFEFENVEDNPQFISLNTKNATLSIGNGFQLKANILPDYVNSAVTWSSSTSNVATVDNDGNVKAVHAGSTYITARTANGLESKCLVKVVEIKPSAMTLNTDKANLSVGSSFQAKATIYPNNTTNKTVTWRSSTPAVASVDTNGNVKALSAGSTYIIARSANGIEKKILVKVVTIPVSNVSMNLTSAKLSIGKSFTAKAYVSPTNATNKSIVYSSSNTKVLSVNSNGVVTSVGAGKAYVYAKASNGKTGKILIEVIPNPASITISPKSATVKVGASFKASSQISPSNAYKSVTFTSSNTSVASVDNSGNVKALQPGSTYVTATTHTGLSSSFLMKVILGKQDSAFIEQGTYSLISPDGKYALDIIGGSNEPLTRAQVYNVNNSIAQNFIIRNIGDNAYTINLSYAQHLVLDVNHTPGAILEGDKVDIYPNNESVAQEWKFTRLSNGNYIIRLRSNPGLVLTRGADFDANGHAIYVGWYSEQYDQCQWKLVKR